MDSQPRVNGKYIKNYVGQVVTLICEVEIQQASGGIFSVKTSDGMTLTVHVPPGEMFYS
jgi:hypothetical protein